MIVVDSSALITILLGEKDAEAFAFAIGEEEEVMISAVTYVETHAVITSRLPKTGSKGLSGLMKKFAIRVEPVSLAQAAIAEEAYDRYGKGRHPAGLNICDCFSYALAKEMDVPLLYKGEDFSQTDIISVFNS